MCMDRFLFAYIFFLELYSHNSILIKRETEENLWLKYKLKHNLKYEGDDDEKRKGIFMKNKRFIEEHNAQNSDLVLEINKFTHLENDEIPKCYTGKNSTFSDIGKNSTFYDIGKNMKLVKSDSDIPLRPSIDYRNYGIIGPVINQGGCGSCYAFSSVGCVESNLAIRRGHFIRLSEQDIVDCSEISGNNGCTGGGLDTTFDHIRKYGISNETSYPYKAKKHTCQKVLRAKIVEDWVNIPFGDESALIEALSFIGPLSVAMDARDEEFMFYRSGIYRSKHCGNSIKSLNHAVLAVGYSLEDEPYLIIKNSWGSDWGDKGYAKIALNSGNMCGIASESSYPIIVGDHLIHN